MVISSPTPACGGGRGTNKKFDYPHNAREGIIKKAFAYPHNAGERINKKTFYYPYNADEGINKNYLTILTMRVRG